MNNAKNDNLEPGLGTRNFEMILRFSKFRENFRLQSGSHDSENFLDLNFAAPLLRNLSLYQIQTITSAIRKLMLDIPSPRTFQNICLLI